MGKFSEIVKGYVSTIKQQNYDIIELIKERMQLETNVKDLKSDLKKEIFARMTLQELIAEMKRVKKMDKNQAILSNNRFSPIESKELNIKIVPTSAQVPMVQ